MRTNQSAEQGQEIPSRTARLFAAGFVAVFSLVSCAVVLVKQPSLGAVIAVAAELAVVAVFCRLMLKKH